jgi:hypothetical protein
MKRRKSKHTYQHGRIQDRRVPMRLRGDPNFYRRLQRNKDTLRPPGGREEEGRELEKLLAWRQPCDRRDGRQRRSRSGPRRQLKPAKDKSTERIDGIVALIMAIGRAMVAQEEPQPEYSLFFV